MSYHDSHMRPGSRTLGDQSKKNYYDELNFWVSRAKNLETLLIEASEHLKDFEMLMRGIKTAGIEAGEFDDEHLSALQKFLRIVEQEIKTKKEEQIRGYRIGKLIKKGDIVRTWSNVAKYWEYGVVLDKQIHVSPVNKERHEYIVYFFRDCTIDPMLERHIVVISES